jgi:hemolysin D
LPPIHVEKGQTVKEGDLLLELDPAEANADALSAQDALNASLAEIARRRYANRRGASSRD